MTEKQREQRRNAPLKHGGAAAVVRIRHGEDFEGPARDKLATVEEELETTGVNAIIERNATRLQAATDLYFDALAAAAQAGDVPKVASHVKTFGWLASKTLLAWKEVKQARKQQAAPALDAVLKDYESEETE